MYCKARHLLKQQASFPEMPDLVIKGDTSHTGPADVVGCHIWVLTVEYTSMASRRGGQASASAGI